MADPAGYLETIEGTITMQDGSTRHFIMTQEGSYVQWGAVDGRGYSVRGTELLGNSVHILEAIEVALNDECVWDDDEEDD